MTRPASSSTRRCFMTPKRVIGNRCSSEPRVCPSCSRSASSRLRRVGSASALNTSSMPRTIGDHMVTCQARADLGGQAFPRGCRGEERMALTPRFRNLSRVARDALLLGLPLLPYVVMIGLFRRGDGAFDLHVFWTAAHSVAHGASPYDPAGVAHARALIEAHPQASASTAWAVYPPAAYIPLIPLGLLPWHVAAAIGVAGVAAAGF